VLVTVVCFFQRVYKYSYVKTALHASFLPVQPYRPSIKVFYYTPQRTEVVHISHRQVGAGYTKQHTGEMLVWTAETCCMSIIRA
jgi:hypothetical protein